MDPGPAHFFCLSPPPGLGNSQKCCEEHLVASLDKALGLDAKLVDITEVAHLPVLGSAVGLRRSEFVFALRFGRKGPTGGPDSSPKAVRRACERALAIGNIGYVDLLYQEVEDPNTPTERTMWELKELILEGKVRYVGLAVDDTELLKRACMIHPLACVCLEWSLWKPRSLDKVVSVARKYGLLILAKDPLGGNGDLSFPANRKQDTATISCKISELLDRQSSALLSMAKEMTEYPEEGLEGKISSISAGQDYSLANSLSQILDEHLRTMERAFRRREEWASCARIIRRASMSQNASFVGRMLTVTVHQRKQLLTKMDTWTGRLQSDGAAVGAFRSLVQAQGKYFVTRFATIRKEQNADLLNISAKVTEDTEFQHILDEMLVKHTDDLTRWITVKKENLTADLMIKLHDLRKHWMSSVKGQLLRTRREQDSEVLQGISPILGDGSKALETVEDVLQSHTSILENSFLDADFGGKPQIVINKIEELVKQQSSDMANKLSVLIEKERGSSASHNDKAFKKCTSSSFIDSYNPIKAALHIRSVVSNRIRAVAQRRGCCEQQVALAWMVSQGSDVLPMVPVKNPGEMVSVVEGTKMSLTDEEMVILYAGADMDQDDLP